MESEKEVVEVNMQDEKEKRKERTMYLRAKKLCTTRINDRKVLKVLRFLNEKKWKERLRKMRKSMPPNANILHKEPPRESNPVYGKAVSLVGISANHITKDAEFLLEISKVFRRYEISVKFTASRNMLENAYKNARRELKKRIQSKLYIVDVKLVL